MRRSIRSLLLLVLGPAAASSTAAERITVPAIPPAAIADSRIDPKHDHDIMELQRLKGLYFYHYDHRNLDAWVSLFTEDAKLMVDREGPEGKTTQVNEGHAGLMALATASPHVLRRVHHGHTPLYVFHSDTEASGIWAMADIVQHGVDQTFYGYGHYRETYRKVNGVWKFSSVHLTRLKTDMLDHTKIGGKE